MPLRSLGLLITVVATACLGPVPECVAGQSCSETTGGSAGSVSGIQVFPDLSAGARLDFYILSSSEYERLPDASPTKQWSGDRLTEPLTLGGNDRWYLLVANRNKESVQLTGSLNVGAI